MSQKSVYNTLLIKNFVNFLQEYPSVFISSELFFFWASMSTLLAYFSVSVISQSYLSQFLLTLYSLYDRPVDLNE